MGGDILYEMGRELEPKSVFNLCPCRQINRNTVMQEKFVGEISRKRLG